jgi:hypothetical protein
MKAISLIIVLFLFSCGYPDNSGSPTEGATAANQTSEIPANSSRILEDNPIILTGNYQLNTPVNYNSILGRVAYITSNDNLISDCQGKIPSCISILQDPYSAPITKNSGNWAFDPNSDNFLQVNALYHLDKQVAKFQNNLSVDFNAAFSPNANYVTSFPSDLYTNGKNWRKGSTLVGYVLTDLPNNATFDPAVYTITFGQDSTNDQVKMVQDPTVIYHENGHNLNQIMMNFRNPQDRALVDLGSLFYDEAGSIGEGLTDWFSFLMNQRTHVFEWAFGRFLDAGRPMRENDYLVPPPISLDADSRLAYPTYLDFNANNPGEITEDVHYAGQIWSFFMVEVVNFLNTNCGVSTSTANDMVFNVLAQSFSEMGDLTAKGNDQTPAGQYRINLDPVNSRQWINQITPLNYRRFSQTFARFFMWIYNDSTTFKCGNGSVDLKNSMEQILDAYGLLNFTTYNENGNSYVLETGTDIPVGHYGTNRSINILNKKKSVSITKEMLTFAPDVNSPSAFVFDNREDMLSVLQALQQSGQIGQISPQLEPDIPYNNGNGQISPGELVGVSLNVFNSSNSMIGGMEIYGNDWDHVSDGKPCNTFGDQWPPVGSGGADSSGEIPPYSPGDCNYITRTNGGIEPGEAEVTDPLYPVCFAQNIKGNATTWVTQDEYIKLNNISVDKCLDPLNPKDCLIKAIPGADWATFSKLNPYSTWAKTMTETNSTAPTFNVNNIILFETSKFIPPGTTFNCRFRIRFGNCANCWQTPAYGYDDFLDYQWSGGEPFKILPLQFTVVN